MHRRRINVQNFGSGWLRPPGVPKTLHQMREERREQEEHQEALRREQLAQELAEAEGGMTEGGVTDDGMMDDVQLDGAQDLDDEIPDADDDFAFSGNSDDDEDEDEEDEDEDEEDEEEDEGDENGELSQETLRGERENNLMATRMRMTDDAFREALIRGDPDGDDMYGGEEELEEEARGQILDEDDLAYDGALGDDGMAGEMEANLDDDIPEAESGGYEHTDSEAELSSSSTEEEDEDETEEEDAQEEEAEAEVQCYNDEDDEDEDGSGGDDNDDDVPDVGFMPRMAQFGPPLSPTLRGRTNLAGPRMSMDLSGILSQDESSFMDSSPAQRPRARRG